ncbi:Uncharacterised protein [Pseudomonas luteola]|jgi:hypothetical protein|uniref:Uncharacterized protein n=1 Tax=Pseudomonas luteola TaxID=47886 RepID=A0A2X2EHH0_PSELU|nr:Uncharacterised protein [Pseudomonas luteola]
MTQQAKQPFTWGELLAWAILAFFAWLYWEAYQMQGGIW